MKKTGLIVVGVVFVLGLVNVIWYHFRPPQNKAVKTALISAADLIPGNKLTDVLKAGGDSMCVFNNKSVPTARSGTIYISNNHVRTNYELTGANSENSKGYLISDADYFYLWTDKNTGFKIQVSAFPGQSATSSAANLLQAYTYMDNNSEIKCLPWQPDMTVFQIPQNIDFKDITKTLLDLKNNLQVTPKPLN